MTSQPGPLQIINRQHYPAYVFHESFIPAQRRQAFGAPWRERERLLGFHFVTNTIYCDDSVASGLALPFDLVIGHTTDGLLAVSKALRASA